MHFLWKFQKFLRELGLRWLVKLAELGQYRAFYILEHHGSHSFYFLVSRLGVDFSWRLWLCCLCPGVLLNVWQPKRGKDLAFWFEWHYLINRCLWDAIEVANILSDYFLRETLHHDLHQRRWRHHTILTRGQIFGHFFLGSEWLFRTNLWISNLQKVFDFNLFIYLNFFFLLLARLLWKYHFPYQRLIFLKFRNKVLNIDNFFVFLINEIFFDPIVQKVFDELYCVLIICN